MGEGFRAGVFLPAILRVVCRLINLGDTVNAQGFERGHEIIPATVEISPAQNEFRCHLRYEISDGQTQLCDFSRLCCGECQGREHIGDIAGVGLVCGFGLLIKHNFQAGGIIAPDLAQTQVIGTVAWSALRPVDVLQGAKCGQATPYRIELGT